MRILKTVLAALALATYVAATAAQTPVGTAFNYQGQLTLNGVHVNNTADLQFSLWDASAGGSQIGVTLPVNGVAVSDGLFTTALDFGAGVFQGDARWLEIAVRTPAGAGVFQTLTPRQELTPAPNAVYATTAGSGTSPFLLQGPDASIQFGPGSDCLFGLFPPFPGLVASDPGGLRVRNPLNPFESIIRFGDQDCAVGIWPAWPGLNLADPTGIRVRNPFDPDFARLIFGKIDECAVLIDPAFPGLNLTDPTGIRVRNPFDPFDTRIFFGETDDCEIGISPFWPGLNLADPVGVRVRNPLDPNLARLIFGKVDQCAILIDPAFPGLNLTDPTGIRVRNPFDPFDTRIFFGETDDCGVGLWPFWSGLNLADVVGVRVRNPSDPNTARLMFGKGDDCAVLINPGFPGLNLTDVTGIRVRNPLVPGDGRLIFGDTDDCAVFIEPSITGINLSDPFGARIRNPFGGPTQLAFGPTNNCLIAVDPGQPGMRFSDVDGFAFEGNVGINTGGPGGVGLELPPIPGLGTVLAFEFVPASSIRWKENVRPLEAGLDTIAMLEPVRFDWKKDHGGEGDIGFIAEEVLAVLPEIVEVNQDGDVVGLAYGRMSAVTVRAIQEQQLLLDELKVENEELLRRLEELERVVSGSANSQ